MSDSQVGEWFKPWRFITDRERELLRREMRYAATTLLAYWDKLDQEKTQDER